MVSGQDCLVSVIVPAYNCAATLQQAVRSALRQDLYAVEVLIVEDGSSDRTPEVARWLAATDRRVRVLTMPRNSGKPSAMNTGIREARGLWVAVLDADDWYVKNRLTTLLSAAERANADLVADNQFVYDDGADTVVRTAFPPQQGDRVLDKALFITGSDPYAEFNFGMLKPVVRADFIRRCGLTYHEKAKLSEDFIYMAEFLAANGKASLVAQPLYYWRQAFGAISRQWTETGAGRWRYDFLAAIEANDELLRKLSSRGERELASLVERRLRAFRHLHRIQEISRLRAEGAAVARVAAEVLKHPSVWALVAQRGFRRLGRR
ncbi:MAG: glycosyltransferase family 2 protein, partial [Acetobacteraceae bacterium]|nr:glycosyltransferase family 2 protein [Acetobacteraceae bacterium]